MSGAIGIAFDCDGTLIDSIGAWHEAEQAILDASGISLTKEQRDELNTLTLDEAGAFFHERFGLLGSGEAVVQAIRDHLLDFYRTRSAANPGALEFVDALAGAGVHACVLSSSPQPFLQAGLERAGMLGYFRHVVSVEDLTTTKRDTATYDHICELLGTEPGRTWLFDDSWYALATARDAGWRTVGVFSSDNCGTHDELGRYAERVIDSFEDLAPAEFLSLCS